MLTGFWARFALIYAFGLLAGAAMGVMGPLAGDIARALGTSIRAVGLTLGMQALAGALIGTLLGGLNDRLGARTLLMAGIVVLGLGDLAIYAAPGLISLGLALLVQGAAITVLLSSGQVLVTGLATGRRQVRGLTVWSTITFTGFASGLLLGGAFGGTPHWPTAFLCHAAACVALIAPGLLLPRVEVSRQHESILGVLRETAVMRMSVALGLAATAGIGVNTSVSEYFHVVHQLPLSVTASAAAIGNVLSIAGSLVLGVVMSRGVSVRRMATAITAIAILSGSLLHLPQMPFGAAVGLLYLYQAISSAIVALVYAALPRLLTDPSRIGAATGMVIQCGAWGAMVGPPVLFAIDSVGNWPAIATVIVVFWGSAYLIMPLRWPQPAALAVAPTA